MKFVRYILAFLREPLLVPIVMGLVVGMASILAVQMISAVAFAPHPEKPFLERMEAMKQLEENPAAMKAWVDALPVTAMVLVLASYQVGAFVGGLVAALLAGRAPYLHSGTIGSAVLAGTIYDFLHMKTQFDLDHPDWMIVAGLLLPLPMSLLAGKFASILLPAEPK